MSLRVGIFMFDQVEVLDFAGPYEVFTTASRVQQQLQPGTDVPFEVVLISADGGPVRARAGLTVQVDHSFEDHPPLDLLLVPGGVVEAELQKPDVIAWLLGTADAATLTASVCTGAFLLATAGLLDGRTATTHWQDINDLAYRFPLLSIRAGCRWVDEGDVVTSGGISAGIDMSLYLVARFQSRLLALRTARQMEFDWTGPDAGQAITPR
ncbi:DJ-1/PfpI family protein [Flagellatimonas centrodinii]|uniref:DJ-1/PfpI family protein n=1 Tax=Flagellatimonas centrodinii TaxID=2806210 RepID=UPI001FF079B1|nr:DJ-1/PfpI family protein [Flagellatimonas centrodinii]ULQ46018.1 DJ-1/PfpI family protein [Flagellatimonas centrodinii]